MTKTVVGADGVTSFAARFLGLRTNPRLGVAIEGEIFPKDGAANGLSKYSGTLHLDFNVIPKGYGWIFPKKDQLSVGVFTTLPKIRDIKKYFSLYVERKGLGEDYACRSLIGHQIPIGGREEMLNTKRGLLVGDAAGLADPITGEGIYFGLRSGQIAADVISHSLSTDFQGLDEYSNKIRNEITNDFKYAGYLAFLLYNVSFISYHLVREMDFAIRAGFKVVAGEHSYRSVIRRIPSKLMELVKF